MNKDENIIELVPSDDTLTEKTGEELDFSMDTTKSEDADSQDAQPCNAAQGESGAAQAEECDVPQGVRATGPAEPYKNRCYLLYGGKKTPAALDLGGTKAFLSDIGIKGGELAQARRGEGEAVFDKEEEGGIACSYCGRPMTGVDYYKLKDGRVRCGLCSRSLVKSEEQLRDIYDRIKTNMELFFEINLRDDVSVHFIDEKKLKKKAGLSIGEWDDKSILILGLAVCEKKNDSLSVYVENSSPRISVIATFAHELTHIWQYTNWDEEKGKKKKRHSKDAQKERLEKYEGMAKWVEIQYLYLIGETKAAAREEKYTLMRMDEYGLGFRKYLTEYPLVKEAMTKVRTPFGSNDPLNI